MESLTSGYRASGADRPERRDQIWSTLVGNEQQQLLDQVQAPGLGVLRRHPLEHTRGSDGPFHLYSPWLPQAVFDLRKALALHAHGITAVVETGGLSRRATRLSPCWPS